MNMQALLKQAQSMQKEITNSQKEIEAMEFTGKNGLVSITIGGNRKVLNVKIEQDDDIKNDLSILEDMIVLATNQAFEQIDKITQEKLGKYANMMPGIM